MSLIPHPKTVSEISQLLTVDKIKYPDYFNYDKRDELSQKVNSVIYHEGFDKKNYTGKIDESKFSLLNAYSLNRAMIQSNEACNKIWATAELLHAFSYWNQGLPDLMFNKKPSTTRSNHKPLCENFNIEFSGGTIIPTLYYAHISSIISILSSFGCVSIRDTNNDLSYNLVRTISGWNIYPRKKFIHDLIGKNPSKGWHNQLYQILEGLTNKIENFPPVNIEITKELAKARNMRHYEILSSLDAKLSRGIDEYFNFLPEVLNTTYLALFVITQIYRPAGLSGIKRFKELYSVLPELFLEFDKTPPELLSLNHLNT